MNKFQNSTEKPIEKKLEDLLSFEQKMSSLTQNNNPENSLGYRIVLSCSCDRSEFSLQKFAIERKDLISKREKVLSSFIEERG